MSNNIYKRLGKLVLPFWPVLIISTFSAIIYVFFNSLSVWLTASLINNILTDFDKLLKDHIELSNNIISLNDHLKYWTNEIILRENPRDTLKVLCFTILLVFVIKNIFIYIKNISLTYIQFNLITEIRYSLYHHFHRLSMSFFDKNRSGELASIVLNDVSNMRIALGSSFHKIFVEPINIITLIIILFIINIKLAFIALGIVPLTLIVIYIIGQSIRRKSKRTAEQIAGILGSVGKITAS